MFPPATSPFPGPYNKNLSQYTNIPILPSSSYYGTSLQPTQLFYNQGLLQANGNRNGQANYGRLGMAGMAGKPQQQLQQLQQKSGQRNQSKNSHHLRVGGKFVQLKFAENN